ncbi:MAG: hypothetical protein K9K67_05580 [Bacteriovoracaceae bacterium]|nr:hypothetical protein [Bacteriovoracaceae bacterium]
MTPKKLSILLITLVSLSSLQTQAQDKGPLSNQKCVEVYRDGYLDLRDAIVLYNKKQLERGEFAAEVGTISTAVSSLRAACYFTESPDVSECVDNYKTLYKGLRERVRVRAVLSGNQESVTFVDDSENLNSDIDQDGNTLRRFVRNIRNQGADAIKKGKLSIIDAKCL